MLVVDHSMSSGNVDPSKLGSDLISSEALLLTRRVLYRKVSLKSAYVEYLLVLSQHLLGSCYSAPHSPLSNQVMLALFISFIVQMSKLRLRVKWIAQSYRLVSRVELRSVHWTLLTNALTR